MQKPQEIIARIVTASPPPAPGFHMLVGPREIQGLVLFSLARQLHDGQTIYWIDAGNWFDAYGLGKAARAAQLDERMVLSRVQVARPFTAIQLTAMLARRVPFLPTSSPVIVSDPMALFYDHEMPDGEVKRIFRDFIDVVKALASPILALGVQREVSHERRGLSKKLLKEARSLAWLKKLPLLQ